MSAISACLCCTKVNFSAFESRYPSVVPLPPFSTVTQITDSLARDHFAPFPAPVLPSPSFTAPAIYPTVSNLQKETAVAS
ncbi:MAG: hypothetical protein JSR76_01850 [Verrucomicrobia bacterium]|nr:hypothetical protein [Verrucomicrobiota bacterium]